MVSKGDYNKTTVSVATLGRQELKQRIRRLKGSFRLDFTDNYLDGLPIERLRHILLAALLNRH